MDVKFNSNYGVNLKQVSENNLKNKTQKSTEKDQAKVIETKRTFLSKAETSYIDILENYARTELSPNKYDHIPNGHSRYEYKGGRLDIYKKGDKYKSQFVYPENYDIEEFFDQLPILENRPIINSGNSKDIISSINGKIDESVSQSSQTGDCWLIAAIKSLAENETGREIIKNSIKVNNDNTVTISFKGIGVSYTIGKEEIEQYDTDSNTSDAYSNGDNDMLVFEIATEKLWKDIKSGKVKLDTRDENLIYTGGGSGIEDGGLPSQMIYYLTGVKSKEYYNNNHSALNKNKVYEALNSALNSNSVINIGIYDNVHSCTLIDGSTFTLDVGSGGHALAVTKVTPNTVTFVNPWDTSIEYTTSWDEFASLGVGYMSVSDLSQINEKEVIDMTDETYEYNYNDHYSDVEYDYNYNKDDRRYNFDFNRKDKLKPDFYNYEIEFNPDNNEVITDYDNENIFDFSNDESKTPNSKYNYGQINIINLISNFFDIFNSLFSLFRI